MSKTDKDQDKKTKTDERSKTSDGFDGMDGDEKGGRQRTWPKNYLHY